MSKLFISLALSISFVGTAAGSFAETSAGSFAETSAGSFAEAVAGVFFGTFAGTFVAMALQPLPASAATVPMAWDQFTEPTENAFTYDVPKGWRVTGGIIRKSPGNAKQWMNAVSPDGAVTIFFGDPDVVKMYMLPNPQLGMRDGGLGSGVTRYWSSAEFGTMYGKSVLPRTCGDIQFLNTVPRPDIIELIHEIQAKLSPPASGPQASWDAAVARFGCDVNGKKYIAGEIAVTAIWQANPAAHWNVVGMQGYRAPVEREAEVVKIMDHMRASMKPNQQWLANELQALNAAGQQAMQAMSQLQASQSAMLRQQYLDSSARLRNQHEAFMAQQQAQGERNRANFANQQFNKDVQHEKEMLYIKDRHLVFDTNSGLFVEVPNSY